MIAADSALPGNGEGASTRPGGGTGRQDGIAHGAGPERLWPTLSSGGVGIGDCGERRYASGCDRATIVVRPRIMVCYPGVLWNSTCGGPAPPGTRTGPVIRGKD